MNAAQLQRPANATGVVLIASHVMDVPDGDSARPGPGQIGPEMAPSGPETPRNGPENGYFEVFLVVGISHLQGFLQI